MVNTTFSRSAAQRNKVVTRTGESVSLMLDTKITASIGGYITVHAENGACISKPKELELPHKYYDLFILEPEFSLEAYNAGVPAMTANRELVTVVEHDDHLVIYGEGFTRALSFLDNTGLTLAVEPFDYDLAKAYNAIVVDRNGSVIKHFAYYECSDSVAITYASGTVGVVETTDLYMYMKDTLKSSKGVLAYAAEQSDPVKLHSVRSKSFKPSKGLLAYLYDELFNMSVIFAYMMLICYMILKAYKEILDYWYVATLIPLLLLCLKTIVTISKKRLKIWMRK